MLKLDKHLTKRLTYGYDCPSSLSHYSNFFVQSLGCTLFALAYSHSPFENIQTTEQGGSIAMAVLNAQYKHPSSAYSQGLKDLIDSMLKINPKDRPDIHQVIVCSVSTNFCLCHLMTWSMLGHRDDRSGTADIDVNWYPYSDAMFTPPYLSTDNVLGTEFQSQTI
jgi:serine/threonine protein kinase